MERTLSVERLYSLGDYRNIKFGDVIISLPEKAMFNDELVAEIQFYQQLTIERAFRRYMDLASKISTAKAEEVSAFLEAETEASLKRITELLTN